MLTLKSIKLSVSTAAIATGLMVTAPERAHAGPDPFVGEMMLFGGSFCPRSWAEADGRLLPIAQNSALFSLFGTMYGGDGRTTFGLPDLRGRVPMGRGTGPGLTPRSQGAKLGVEHVTLTQQQMPAHNHNLVVNNGLGDRAKPGSDYLAEPNTNETKSQADKLKIYSDTLETPTTLGTNTISNSGGNQAHENMMPAQVIRWCVALQGVYPSRN